MLSSERRYRHTGQPRFHEISLGYPSTLYQINYVILISVARTVQQGKYVLSFMTVKYSCELLVYMLISKVPEEDSLTPSLTPFCPLLRDLSIIIIKEGKFQKFFIDHIFAPSILQFFNLRKPHYF